jgi:hypothetical protein
MVCASPSRQPHEIWLSTVLYLNHIEAAMLMTIRLPIYIPYALNSISEFMSAGQPKLLFLSKSALMLVRPSAEAAGDIATSTCQQPARQLLIPAEIRRPFADSRRRWMNLGFSLGAIPL